MTLTLLLDLDDTLLGNHIDTFLPAYLNALGKHLINHVSPDRMTHHLLAATRVMLENNTAVNSLEQSFDGAFYPAIGKPKEQLRPLIEQFYDDVFPELQPLTHQRPEAVQMVEQAVRQGHTLVVATNPIFPLKAILHRLNWAGLPAEQVPFRLITAYEDFHFAKPNPAYYAEVLAQLGWPNQPAVMIGNSLEDDIIPASQLGMPVYWVTAEAKPLPDTLHPLSASGSLLDIPAWIEKIDAAGLKMEFKTPKALLSVLKSTAPAMQTLSMNLTERQWYARPEPKEWSLTEIFCHMRDVDREVNIPRMERIATEEVPFLAGINTDAWIEERNYSAENGPTALKEFVAVRTQLIALLEAMPESNWQQPARHAIFGPTNLQELVSFITTHDRTHVQQCQAAVRALA
jgi:FMN phosphatase YigB (HAD superfamily)